MRLTLDGHVALITGGSQGIGEAIARRFAGAGSRVAICARGRERLASVADAIRSETGADVVTVAADCSRPADVVRMVDEVEARCGRIDILVNSAGSAPGGSFFDLGDDAWEQAAALKLLGTIRVCRAVLRGMRRRQSGRIINVIGTGGRQPTPHMMPSGVMNAGLINFTKALGRLVAPEGIVVNGVNPGLTLTPRLESVLAARAQAVGEPVDVTTRKLAEEIPLGRFVTADDVAAVALFLAAGATPAIVGSVIDVDGGRTAGI
jgi:NAD(P)-dependent dehydrogenase (short-subunit alcohol dehydrogenase family)